MKAVITAQFDEEVIKSLAKEMEVVHIGWGVSEEILPQKELIGLLKKAEIFVTELEVCSREVIEQSPNLAFIGCCRNNPVNIDVDAASKRGIPVVYTPGRNAQAVAEMTIGMMIMLARQMGRALVDVNDKKWTPEGRFSYLEYKGYELEGKIAGILGLGAIGRKVRDLCQAFGMKVIVYDPYLQKMSRPGDPTTFVNFDTVITESDFISIHVPDTPETVGMIGPGEFARMKKTAYLINTARGKHVNEEALFDALSNHRIAGAALDVFHLEPIPLDHPYFSLDNILLFPHIGGATYDVIRKQSIMIYEQIRNFLQGKQLSYLRNPEIYR